MAKKILILTVVAGGGHTSAANSVTTRIKELEPDAEVEIVDVLKTYSTYQYYTLKYGYSILIGKLPFIYSSGYWLSNHGIFKNLYATGPLKVARTIAPKLYQRINETKPDVIYCTHFYPAIMISLLRLVGYKVPPVTITSECDYAVEPFYDKARNVDYITIADDIFIPGLIHGGYKLEQIKVTGIPTQSKFYIKPDKKEFRKELGLDPNIFTVTVMFGGGEWAGTYKIYKNLIKAYKKQLQVIVINGTNKKTFKKLSRVKNPPNIKLLNVGYTKEVEKYMGASDLALTKAGGLSTTEMVNIGLPMLIFDKVYGQEYRNKEYMRYHGVALQFKNARDLAEKIDVMIELKEMFNNKFEAIRKHGADNIANLILSQPKPEYDDAYIASLDYSTIKKQLPKRLDELIHFTSKKYL